MPTRITELTLADFERCPVWQFAVDAEGEPDADETCVTAVPGGFGVGAYGSFVVFARYRMNTGQEYPGAVQVDVLGRKLFFTPAILYAGGKSLDPLAPDLQTRVFRITKESARPLAWTLRATLSNELSPRTGRMAQSRLLRIASAWLQLVRVRFVPRGRG